MEPIEFQHTIYNDERGSFMETHRANELPGVKFVQSNQSISKRGVIRGLHYQEGEFAQAKLVRVSHGSVIDFVVDIRRGSPEYGKLKWYLLTWKNGKSLFIPSGFAHGFVALEDDTVFSYNCDNYYNKDSERGINLFSPGLGIMNVIKENTNLKGDDLILSWKDRLYPDLAQMC